MIDKKEFDYVVRIINNSRERALRQVNKELIEMYRAIGKFLSKKAREVNYGDAYISSLSKYIKESFPGIKGFNRRGLYRMKQFYEIYEGNEIVSPLVTQLSWTNHLLLISKCKTNDEREFYMKLAIKERYSKRQLERQIDSGYYEKFLLTKETNKKGINDNKIFMDSYVLEFLNLPLEFNEKDFRKRIISEMKEFILEIGSDFIFVDEEYPIPIGTEKYYVDLLFL